MRNLLPLESDNLGGLEAVFYTAHSNLVLSEFPEQDGLRLVGDIKLKPGATWGMLCFTRNTPGFSLTPKRDKRGTYYGYELKGYFPQDRPELAELMLELMEGRHVVLYRDNNGFLKLVGHPDYSLSFEYKSDTGDGPSNRNAYNGGFKGESVYPGFFYSGNFEVTELGEANPPGPEGSGAPVTVMFNGEVVRILQPGQTLDVESEFTMEFKIKI